MLSTAAPASGAPTARLAPEGGECQVGPGAALYFVTAFVARPCEVQPVPIYEYRCNDCGHQFEVSQRMSDDPLTECEVCGGEVTKVLFAPAIHFKGTGFHNTDYGSKRRAAGDDSGGSGSGDASGNGSSGGDAKPAGDTASSASGSSSSAKTVGLDKI
jgi:putative FmdB family regulatory protein